MSRKLAIPFAVCLWSISVSGPAIKALAQTPPDDRQPRPANNANLQVQNLPPALEQLLIVWSQSSAKIDKLQGTHHRFVYDKVFNIDKRSTGAFYYEAPGKGRIDLKPAEIRKGEVSKQTDPKTGEPFKVQADRAERWICDGTSIWQVNDVTKQVDVFPIPQENQGQNIMDGPMPFLFGMPPAKAKRRYFLELVDDNKDRAVLKVKPRWQVDAANWSQADVILDKKLYLPTAVRLTDPSGNLVTTYTFGDFHINKDDRNWIVKVFGGGDKDPFRPELKGYHFKVHKVAEADGGDGPQIPSVAGMNWEQAKNLLEKLECKVNIHRGQNAPNEKLNYVVYQQKPAAKTPLQKGQVVDLVVYDLALVKVAQATGRVPPVLGLPWKKAGQQMEQAGFKVKWVQGKPADAEEKIYMVYQQSPNAGQSLDAGSEVTLTVYDKQE